MRPVLARLMLALAITTAACGSTDDDPAASSGPTSESSSADGGQAAGGDSVAPDPAVPASCTPENAEDLVVGLFDAVNAGEVDVDRYFATDSNGFRWLAIGGPGFGPGDSEDRSLLAAYFESRIAVGETMHLLELEVSYQSDRDLGNLSLLVDRSADDIPDDTPLFAGKGSIHCGSGRLVVLAMGPSEEMRGPCTGDLPAEAEARSQPVICPASP